MEPGGDDTDFNERLRRIGKLDAFQAAERDQDLETMVALMEEIGLVSDDATGFRASPPADAPPYAGMTVNERLFTAGLMDSFDQAFARRDRAAMIAILKLVDMGELAAQSVDTMLRDPAKYEFGE